jgi:hypothetical protein
MIAIGGNERARMVGAWRFELQTSCAQGRRATRLRYAPTGWALPLEHSTAVIPAFGSYRDSRAGNGAELLGFVIECNESFCREVRMIRKTAGGYKVLSEKGKNLGGPYKTRAQAEKRLRQVEFFKHRKG